MQAETRKTVSTLSSEYNKASKSVAELVKRYNESVAATSKTSSESKNLKIQLNAAEAQLKTTASALKAANNGMENFQGSTKKAAASQKELGSGASTATSSLFGLLTKANLLTSALQSLAGAVVSVGKSIIQMGVGYNTQLETYQTAFTNMLGSAEKASAFLEQLKSDASRTPFDTDTLVKANQYLLGAGENAEYSRKTILALGDAVKATGGGNDELNRMAQNIQQIANVGKASSMDIKQFAYAGINIYQVLAKYTGKSVQDVKDMTITYDVLTQALQAAAEEGGLYYNAMNTQSQTMSGRLTTLKDNALQLAGVLTEDLSDAFGVLISKANDWVVALKNAFEEDGVEGLADKGGEIALEVVSGFSQKIPQLEQQAVLAVQNLAQYLQKNTSTIVAAGKDLLFSLADGIVDALPQIVNAAMDVTISFETELINHYDEFMVKGYEILGKIVSGLMNCLGHMLSAIEDLTSAAVKKIFETGWVQVGKDMVSAIADGIIEGLPGIKEAAGALVRILNPAATTGVQDAVAKQGGKTSSASNGAGRRANSTNMEWDENNGWVKKGTENNYNGNGSSRNVNSSITSDGSGSTTKKTKSKTEKVIESISHTATTTSQNALGTVTTSIQTLNEKVKDSAGKIKDRVTTTTTETGKEMVNGVATTYKKVETKVNGTVTKVTKTYDDMSKTLLGTLTSISETTFNGITTKIQEATEKYADGSEHVKRTETETGEHIVDGVAQTYTKVITYIDGVQDKVTETETAIDKSVKATQTRIDQYLSGASSESNKGIFGILRSFISDAKNGDAAAIGLDFVNLLWGEVTQDQREAISKWAKNALEVINEAYSGGGLKNAFAVFEKIFTGGGVEAGVDGVTTKVIGLTEALQKLGATGGAGGVLANVGTGLASFGSKIMGVLGNVVAFVAENPIALAIAAVVAGAVGLGIALWKKYKSDSSSSSSSPSKIGYKDLQDAYWYGNERAFAGYDYRSDPYTFNPNSSTMLSYQTKMQDQLARLTEVVQQYLPDVANQQIVLDDGTLVGKMAPGMDAQLGQLSVLAERGN
nr:MAG TPA: tail tape measure protein [Caudoviricetes sp.]